MLDDLRNSVNSEFLEEEIEETDHAEEHRRARGPFLGMTAAQRFIIALFLFLMVAILGVFLLIVFQKIYLPI